MEDTLNKLRNQIDVLDDELVTLLTKRMKVVEQVGKLKKQQQIEPLDTKRWEEVLKSKMQKAKSLGLSEQLVEKIYNIIHEHALKIEKNV